MVAIYTEGFTEEGGDRDKREAEREGEGGGMKCTLGNIVTLLSEERKLLDIMITSQNSLLQIIHPLSGYHDTYFSFNLLNDYRIIMNKNFFWLFTKNIKFNFIII